MLPTGFFPLRLFLYMYISGKESELLISELRAELGARLDGGGKNLIARCPFCGKEGKFGVYIGRETARKKPFMAHCFSCGRSTTTLEKLLESLGRMDLLPTDTASLGTLPENALFPLEDVQDEVDDELGIVSMPDYWRRTFTHPYLQGRGFTYDDYDCFPVGTTCRLNRRWDDYVIFPVVDAGDTVGYVARHTWSKEEIDRHNCRAKRNGDYKILRWRNSTENDFVKLLYNYDAIAEGETDTVVLVEGIFDVVALTRKLDLYDNRCIAAVATFGKKISRTQIYKLQSKGVRTVVIGYDGDAVEAVKHTASELSAYFEVLVADIPDSEKDWEDLSPEEIYRVFAYGLKTPVEYQLTKIQQ